LDTSSANFPTTGPPATETAQGDAPPPVNDETSGAVYMTHYSLVDSPSFPLALSLI